MWSAYGVYSATVQSYNKSIIALPRVGQYGKIFSSLVLYCPSLRSGQYCHHRAEYFPILPSQSCNNIYTLYKQAKRAHYFLIIIKVAMAKTLIVSRSIITILSDRPVPLPSLIPRPFRSPVNTIHIGYSTHTRGVSGFSDH